MSPTPSPSLALPQADGPAEGRSSPPGRRGRGAWAPYVLFGVLLALKYAAILRYPIPARGFLNGDAAEYVPQARLLWNTGSLPDEAQFRPFAQGSGDLRYTNFRPPGYPVLLAPLLAFGREDRDINFSARVLHSALDVAVHVFLFAAFCSLGVSALFRAVVAFILGVQPWTSTYVIWIVPDVVATFLAVFGIAALALGVVARRAASSAASLVLGSLLLSAAFLVRAEMIVFAPVLVVLALALRRPGWKAFFLHGALASLPFFGSVAANVAYRLHVDGKLAVFGRFQHATPGLLLWAKTWPGSQRLKESVLWGWRYGSPELDILPEGIFDNDIERETVRQVLDRIRRTGQITPADDAAFMNVARERIERDPLRYYLGVRLYQTAHLWINHSPSSYLLARLGSLPALVADLVLAFFAVIRAGLFVLAAFGIIVALFRRRSARESWPVSFVLFGAAFALLRTLLFGMVRCDFEWRYVVPAWPFVLFAAGYGLSRFWPRPAPAGTPPGQP